MRAQKLTKAQRRVLADASRRTEGTVCPTIGLRGGPQTSVLRCLFRMQFIEDEVCPIITDAGRAALAASKEVDT
jgi:hypothetical protein